MHGITEGNESKMGWSATPQGPADGMSGCKQVANGEVRTKSGAVNY